VEDRVDGPPPHALRMHCHRRLHGHDRRSRFSSSPSRCAHCPYVCADVLVCCGVQWCPRRRPPPRSKRPRAASRLHSDRRRSPTGFAPTIPQVSSRSLSDETTQQSPQLTSPPLGVPSTDKDYAEAVNNFIKSVAGYCGTLCSVVPCVVCVVCLVCCLSRERSGHVCAWHRRSTQRQHVRPQARTGLTFAG
jgi:hypothetical protein